MDSVKEIQNVKEYYGSILKSNQDLKTSACCTMDSMPPYLLEILKQVHDEVKDKFYGCGSPIPHALEGKTVLDLGSGSGRDCFILSKLVGSQGKVIGVDMTEEQILVARKYKDYHASQFGQATSNIEFLNGYIEDLESLGIEDDSIDIVISNCVINLSPNKKKVFSEIFRVLKPGGELYFSDVFSNRRVPLQLVQDPILYGECLSGAIYIEDFRRLLYDFGCKDFRIVSNSNITLHDPQIKQACGKIDFYSMTIRAFKLPLEDRCEDYGQVAIYQGGIPNSESVFVLDDHHEFEMGKPMLVCGNTAMMLQDTRYSDYFQILGHTKKHYGLFDCGLEQNSLSKENSLGACC
ncbi:MAG: methyltransferase domain-containing protein [Leptospira sp.]|nr:methyltransferase domain-containing protein [Leptospira sp.]